MSSIKCAVSLKTLNLFPFKTYRYCSFSAPVKLGTWCNRRLENENASGTIVIGLENRDVIISGRMLCLNVVYLLLLVKYKNIYIFIGFNGFSNE